MMCGAPTASQPATAETQSIADQVKPQLEERENKKYATFKAVEFRSQVVAGRNYFIKVQVDDDEFVHLRVFQSLPHENKPLALSSYQTNKARHDELAYF
ncbi:cystatin-B [Ursus americanus]|uniref:Cystatin-B n=2 Tax=Ursus TaxID=9639 RepID=A0A8M1F2X4_URSMA|nr:cystatin-B [Ursus arctos]XP_040477788.1 cystatin-B [Ursus maritimus]XP_045630142.1 cystatin-B [Ursus americanus]